MRKGLQTKEYLVAVGIGLNMFFMEYARLMYPVEAKKSKYEVYYHN